MKNISIVIALGVIAFVNCLAGDSVKCDSSITSSVTITILYDNAACDKMFKQDWGFACVIEGLQKTILFDAGARPDILLHNMNQAHIDPNQIQYLVISHGHGDHTDGLASVTGGKNLQCVYLPEELGSIAMNQLNHVELKNIVVSSPLELFPYTHLTGAMGDKLIEQSLIIETPQGLVLITGCSHPGIVSILKKAKQLLKKDPYVVLGGFHLLNHSDVQINAIIDSFKTMGVRYCGATHCTGDKSMAAFRKAYGDHFVELGAGRIITLDKDGKLHFSQ
ncbi:MAG: MBL fold metallo-hydrolase [bacterium]